MGGFISRTRDFISSIVQPSDISRWRKQADDHIRIIGPDSYPRIAPDLFNVQSTEKDLQRWFYAHLGESSVSTPPEDIYILKHAYVSQFPIVYTAKKEVFGPARMNLFEIPSFESLQDENEPEVLDDEAAFIFLGGERNFGHRLVEMVAKLENLVYVVSKPLALLLPDLGEKFAIELQAVIDAIYPGKFFLRPMTRPVVCVKKLYYPGPIASHNKRKSRTLIRFADRLKSVTPPGEEKKIYVSREKSHQRIMENELEVRALFESIGFKTVYPETLSLIEQCALFSGATDVAGPLGAALTNIVFCPEGGQVFMIDPGFYDFFFWDLAGLRGLSFKWHFSDKIVRFHAGRSHENYTVPLGSLKASLEAAYGMGGIIPACHEGV